MLRNIYVPYNGKTSEIDVLMIHEKGIFVFESKNYSGWIFGGFEDAKWTQSLPNKQKKQHIENIGNKIRKQTKECENLVPSNVAKFIDESINSVSIEESKLYKELKPYFIYSNSQLEEIVNKKPKTVDELKAIKGVGNAKCEKYGGI